MREPKARETLDSEPRETHDPGSGSHYDAMEYTGGEPFDSIIARSDEKKIAGRKSLRVHVLFQGIIFPLFCCSKPHPI